MNKPNNRNNNNATATAFIEGDDVVEIEPVKGDLEHLHDVFSAMKKMPPIQSFDELTGREKMALVFQAYRDIPVIDNGETLLSVIGHTKVMIKLSKNISPAMAMVLKEVLEPFIVRLLAKYLAGTFTIEELPTLLEDMLVRNTSTIVALRQAGFTTEHLKAGINLIKETLYQVSLIRLFISDDAFLDLVIRYRAGQDPASLATVAIAAMMDTSTPASVVPEPETIVDDFVNFDDGEEENPNIKTKGKNWAHAFLASYGF